MRLLLLLLLSFIICDIKVYSQSEINVHVDIPGTLHEKLPERDNCYIAALKISGSLNEEDLKVVSDWGSDNKKKFDLDLSEAGINTIAYQTFAGSYLRKIILPNTITEIEREAFFKCSYLEYVDFSLCSNLTKIGIKAFAGCSNLILVDLSQCVALKDLQGSQQFDGCLSLRSFILPPNIEVMFTYWFGLFCDNISFLEIPSSVKKMIIEKDGIKNATFKMHTKPELNIWSCPPYGPLFRVPKGTKLSWDNSGISVNEYSSKHYNFKLHYNDEGGVVRIGNRIYKSGENIEIEDWSLFYFYVEPKLGYHVKSTKNIHRTGYKTYSFYNFNFDQEASLEFEKDAPVYLNVNYSEGGSVR
ncbi:MAG: leucine-rich repeat domain-containing protein, partial [Parabacteroides distasonis]